jgi:hypothetical protein
MVRSHYIIDENIVYTYLNFDYPVQTYIMRALINPSGSTVGSDWETILILQGKHTNLTLEEIKIYIAFQ